MANYIPEKVFKHLSVEHINALLSEFKFDFGIDKIKDDLPFLLNRWNELLNIQNSSDPNLHKVSMMHDFLQELSEVAEGKCDMTTYARELVDGLEDVFELPSEFDSWTRYNQGVFLFLNNSDLWDNLCHLVNVCKVSSSRLWTVYDRLPKITPSLEAETMQRLEDMLTDYFATSKHCISCKIRHYIRRTRCFFFATMQDKPQYWEVHNDQTKDFEPTPLVLPFRLIFSYDEEDGEFAIYGKIGKADFNVLAGEIVRILVGYEDVMNRAPKATYDLSQLKNRSFDFFRDAEDGIENIWIKSITIAPEDDQKMEITLRHSMRNIYDCLEEFMNRNRLTDTNIEIRKATITIKMQPRHPKFRSFTFEIGTHTCDLHGLSDCKRIMGEKYIKKWGFKVG